MATDYDAPRPNPDEETAHESLEVIQARGQGTVQVPVIDDADADTAEGIDLPGADLSEEELTIRVIPAQGDEFVCGSCFLVHHRSQLAREAGGKQYCTDCEG